MSSNRNLKVYAAMSASFLAMSPNAIGGVLAAPINDASAAPALAKFDPNRDHLPFELLAPPSSPSAGVVKTLSTTFTSNFVDIDFDDTPNADIEFQVSNFNYSSAIYLFADGGGSDIGLSYIATGGNNYAAKLSAGYAVSAGANWAAGTAALCQGANGPWANGASTEYLGVRINLNGSTHYGWIELSSAATGDCNAPLTIHRIGYETTPDTPIPTAITLSQFSANEAETAPWQIATLGAALLSTLTGLFAWFRRKQSA